MPRTAVCDFCGAGGLKLDKTPVGTFLRDYHTDEFHVCPNANGATVPTVNGSAHGPDVSALKDRVDQLSSAFTQVGQDLTSVASRVTDAENALTRPTSVATIDRNVVLDIVHEENRGVREALSDLTSAAFLAAQSQIKRQVEDLVGAMVPTSHEIRVLRADGTERKIAGRPHAELETLVQLASLRLNALMVGPAGSGKTTAGQQVAEALGLPFYSLNLGPSHDEWALLGFKSPDGVYVPGFLREPYEHGGVVLLDEMDNARADALVAINTLIENGHAQFPDGRIERHPDFVLIAGANTYGKGGDRVYMRNQLDGATLNRYAIIDWDYDETAEFEWAGADAREWVEYVQKIRHAAAALKLRLLFAPRQSVNGAKALRGGMPREKVEALYLWAGVSADDQMRIKANLN